MDVIDLNDCTLNDWTGAESASKNRLTRKSFDAGLFPRCRPAVKLSIS
jgi:hypothetical protein